MMLKICDSPETYIRTNGRKGKELEKAIEKVLEAINSPFSTGRESFKLGKPGHKVYDKNTIINKEKIKSKQKNQ